MANFAGRRAVARILLALFVLLPLVGSYRPAQANPCAPFPPYLVDHDRFGINVVTDHGRTLGDYAVEKLNAGWYVDYRDSVSAKDQAVVAAHGLTHVPILRVSDLRDNNWRPHLAQVLAQNRGRLYVIGNEPDRDLQDGMPADEYAQLYHDIYYFIKEQDPSAKVAVAAIVQATPLRLRYLDLLLDTYKKLYGARLPTDFWNIHGFVLREDQTWGAGIPPGLQAYAHEGKLYEISDHGRIDILKEQIVNFRQWMAQRGYRSYPLIVSEYGILLPPLYGYTYEVVRDFMLESFEFFTTATDTATGYPSDEYRLVQAWSWYSLNELEYDLETGIGFNGNLMDHNSGELTPLGNDFATVTGSTYAAYTDVALNQIMVEPETISSSDPISFTVVAEIINRGTVAAREMEVLLSFAHVGDTQATVVARATVPTASPRCASVVPIEFTWGAGLLETGHYILTVEIVPNQADNERTTVNQVMKQVIEIGEPEDFHRLYVPLIGYE